MCSGGRWDGRPPWGTGHGAAQDFYDVAAVLAGGVDIAADVQAVLGGLFAGEPTGYLLLGLDRADAALADVVGGPDPGVVAEPQDVLLAVAAEFQQIPAGVPGGGVLWPGDAGHAGAAGQDSVAELADQRAADGRRYIGQAGVTSFVPGADQPA